MPKHTLTLALMCLVWTTTATAESDPAGAFDERFDVLITVRDVAPLTEAVAQLASSAEPGKADEVAALFDGVRQVVVGRACLALELPEAETYGSLPGFLLRRALELPEPSARVDVPDFLFRVPVDESAVTVADLIEKSCAVLLGPERTVIEQKGGIGEIGSRDDEERLYWAVRGGVFYASSRRETVEAATGRRPPQSLARNDAYRALGKHVDWTGDVTVYVRLAKLPWAGPPPDAAESEDPPDTFWFAMRSWLALDQFRSVGFSWNGDAETASGRLAVLTKQGRRGLAGLVDVPNAPMSDLDRIPENCQLFYWSAPLGGGMVDRIAQFMAELDPDIAEEFRTELAEFNQELGVDLEKDLFENIGEQTHGLRMPGPGRPAVYGVIGVEDADALQHAVDALAGYNKTPLQKLEGDEQIYHVIPSKPPLFYMFHEGRALLSNNLGDVQEMIALTAVAEPGAPTPGRPSPDASSADASKPRTLADAEVFAKLRERLPDENVFVFAADMSWAGKAVGTVLPWIPEARTGLSKQAVSQFLVPLQQTEPGLTFAVAVRNEPDAYVLHVEDLSGSTRGLLAGAAKQITASFTEARQEAQQRKSAKNLLAIGLASNLWLDQHGEPRRFPPSLQALLDDGALKDPKIFLCPGSGTQLKEGEFVSDYDSLFDRVGLGPKLSDVPSSLMIAWEKEPFFAGNRSAAFADSHVETFPEDRFQEELTRVEEWIKEHKPSEENIE